MGELPTLLPSKGYEKAVKKLDAINRKKLIKAMVTFQNDPKARSISFERMMRDRTICSIRMSDNHRIIMQDVGDNVFILLDVGNHDIYYKY